MTSLGHEIVPYGDMMTQMWDMLYVSCDRAYICLEDLLQPNVINVAGSLFDALFNLYKFIGFEQVRDGLSFSCVNSGASHMGIPCF